MTYKTERNGKYDSRFRKLGPPGTKIYLIAIRYDKLHVIANYKCY